MDQQTCLSSSALDLVIKAGALMIAGLVALFTALITGWKIETTYLRSLIDRQLTVAESQAESLKSQAASLPRRRP
jgi:hypothetical protein